MLSIVSFPAKTEGNSNSVVHFFLMTRAILASGLAGIWGTMALLLLCPFVAYAYSQASYYSQSSYYSQGTYYSQGSYVTTINKNVSETGTFTVAGTLSKATGTFVIDHPLDPKNKLLFHSFVESPDVKNFYDGIAKLNDRGEAAIRLPRYFMALNTEFRYEVKPIGTPMPDLFVKEGITENRFTIGGGTPGGRVSWQVTGIRQDPYILANPIEVEVEKGPNELADAGDYLHEGLRPTSPLPSFLDLFSWLRSRLGQQ